MTLSHLLLSVKLTYSLDLQEKVIQTISFPEIFIQYILYRTFNEVLISVTFTMSEAVHSVFNLGVFIDY